MLLLTRACPRFVQGLAILLAILVGTPSKADEPIMSVKARVDFGNEAGRDLGSLFEIKDASGRVVCGAGFPVVYNTRFLMDRQTLQFYVRPAGETQQQWFKLERLPRPDEHAGLYMYDFAGRLCAINDVVGGPYREWDPAEAAWRPAGRELEGLSSSYEFVSRLGNGVLKCRQGSVSYNDRAILKAPDVGTYNHFYYGQGRLFFYHTHFAETGGFSRIYACRWTPDSTELIDPGKDGDAISVLPVGVTTWAFGQLGPQVLTVTNHGGVYVHDGKAWRSLREPVASVSYQVYSVLNYYDKLLLGHYPTGEIFEFDGVELKQLKGSPPKLDAVSSGARECQTLAIYRGELFAGVWPWGEVWRQDGDGGRWQSMGRMFTHPQPTDRTTQPYEEESTQRGLVLNHWGQRVTSLVPVGDSLYISTSAKSNNRNDPVSSDFLSDDQRKEYGAVLRLTMPGNLSVPVAWTKGPTELTCEVFADRLSVRQDGREIGTTPIDASLAASLKGATLAWGTGIFGPLGGELLETEAKGTGLVEKAAP